MHNLGNRAIRRRRRGEGGFTLIELLVVIAILGILAGIVIFNVTGVTQRGQAAACNTDETSVQSASDAYYSDHGVYPTETGSATLSSGLLVPAYLHTWPTEQAWAINTANGTVTNTCPS